MIGISKLYCGAIEPSDALRYGRRSRDLPSHLLQFSQDKKPVVVWNITRRCNLSCAHCYARAVSGKQTEFSTARAKEVIDDLAELGSPVLLFSGGEPLMRKDLPELASYAVQKGMRAVISSNGTLIDRAKARELKQIGLSYVGISLDGGQAVHDSFRGQDGAYTQALQGLENCQLEGLKVGLRFTVFRQNMQEVPGIFDLIQEREIPRVCFYHLVYSGRGSELIEQDLDQQQTRQLLDLILERTSKLFDRGLQKEVLTVDNHADGPYLYLRLLREDPARAAEVLQLLKYNEGNNSGRGIGCISWDGEVYADQFWRNHSFGNVLERPFSRIWLDPELDLLQKLKRKKEHVKGRCSRCRYLDVCAGNFRARAEAYYGDVWAPDPACYLTDQEIGLLEEQQED
ncbi:MAG: 12,18-didecarboxysiroheme deacetylase [Desulfohalobiaceae bacterium]